MAKTIPVFDDLCSGCRSCEIWCSLFHGEGDEFNPLHSKIRIAKDAEEFFDVPVVDCTGENCHLNDKGEPICVELLSVSNIAYLLRGCLRFSLRSSVKCHIC